MLLETYPACYRDRFGEVATMIRNDGKELHMTLRGVEFTGEMLDDWVAHNGTDAVQLQQFFFNGRELCDFVLELAMPLPIFFQTEPLSGTLHVRLTIGVPTPNGGVDREVLFLKLDVAGSSFSSQGKNGWFEGELYDILKQLPEGMYMQTCFCCAFSDYSPFGNGLFGCLACFRNNKQRYLAVETKKDLLDIWNTHTEFVQETYHCVEFERRKPGRGYRGWIDDWYL